MVFGAEGINLWIWTILSSAMSLEEIQRRLGSQEPFIDRLFRGGEFPSKYLGAQDHPQQNLAQLDEFCQVVLVIEFKVLCVCQTCSIFDLSPRLC